MGGYQNLAGVTLAVALLAMPAVAATGRVAPRKALAEKAGTLDSVRAEINTIEKDLLTSREYQISAANQLKKIRRLLSLQQKEIQLSQKKVADLARSLEDLSKQKQQLQGNIEKQKLALKMKLRELQRLTGGEALDASWMGGLDAENQKIYFLSKTLKKDLKSVETLKADVLEAQSLELKIIEEKNKLDYYVQELHGQMSLLTANEDVQKEIIRTNRASRLEALERMRSLKESERELEQMIASFRSSHAVERARAAQALPPAARNAPVTASAVAKLPKAGGSELASGVEVSLMALKGKLPFPVEGQVVSVFGKSYNPKTNLLTFQKGITLGTRPSTEVRAVAPGKVVFAGPLKNYGLIAIVEHAGQYYTLYGQMGTVAVSEGTAVRSGDTLGKTAAEPLYFEIRNKNVAINPLQWLTGGPITLGEVRGARATSKQ